MVVLPEVVVTPATSRYFYSPESDLDLSASAAIPAALFTDDAGGMTSVFIGIGPSSFINLYINGILQPGSAYGVSSGELVFPPQSTTIYGGTPIILEIVQFTASVIP
jgi:hypothetical protein